MDLGLKDKRVVVTGASRGIGRAIATAFAAEGARVYLVARTEAVLARTAKDIGGLAKWVAADCAEAADLEKAREQMTCDWGGVDVVVANVGDGRSEPGPLPHAARFAQTWRANFTTAETTARAFLPALEESRGCLLFIGSITGLEALGAPTDYSVAKTAVTALAGHLARKLAPAVRVNCLAPGNVLFPGGSWDDKRQADPEGVDQLIAETVPLQRFGVPGDIARAAMFLCSASASFITGATLCVDGGQTTGILR